MSDRLPPLAWIRAFHEAGRQPSFSAAADALHVSPSTISHEIRSLEQWLKLPLFDRSGRSAKLTPTGRQLHDHVSTAFGALAEGFAQLEEGAIPTLRIGVFPFVASEFLLPRLEVMEDLAAGHRIELLANTHTSALDLQTPPGTPGKLDAVIRYDPLPIAGFDYEPLTAIDIQAVQSGARKTRTQRITVDGGFDAWEQLRSAGQDIPDLPISATTFDSYLSGLKAVAEGYGVGVAVLPLSAEWLRDGRLRALGPGPVRLEEHYCLVWPWESPHSDRLRQLGIWLRTEFAELNPAQRWPENQAPR